jgi:hypothetical protein
VRDPTATRLPPGRRQVMVPSVFGIGKAIRSQLCGDTARKWLRH